MQRFSEKNTFRYVISLTKIHLLRYGSPTLYFSVFVCSPKVR